MWDWNLVGELVLGIGAGMAVGGFLFSQAFAAVGWRLLSHPTTRKLAGAAEKVSSQFAGGVNTWPGLIGGVLNWISGGKFSQQGGTPLRLEPGHHVVEIDSDGNVLKEYGG